MRLPKAGPFRLLFAMIAPVIPLRHLQDGAPAEIIFSKAGKATAVVFLSAHCPCSRSHEEKLSSLCQGYSARGIRCIGVHSNADESSEEARRYFSGKNFSFPVYQDVDAGAANMLGALKTPHVFLVSPAGEILFSGGVDDSRDAASSAKNYLETAFSQVTQGQRPQPSEVKALGCFIARP